jgi:molybdate transport system substrate-binding protein
LLLVSNIQHYRLVVFALLASFAAAGALAAQREIVVFGAISLTDALGAAATQFERDHGVRVKQSYAASSILARQIEAGARADVFASADADWMDYLAQRKLIDEPSRRTLASNRLVLIAPAASAASLRIAPNFALAAALGQRGRLAMGDPEFVPAGRYAKAALVSLGIWPTLRSRVVGAQDARAAVMFVARGETPFGIVFRTDALLETRIRIVDTFAPNTHPPIQYPIATLRGAAPQARVFVDFLLSPAGKAVLRDFGFAQPMVAAH